VRVVIVEDQALLREGIVALLREHHIDVVAQAEDGPGLLRIVDGHKPDLAIVDVRLPPTFTDEGIRAAIRARERRPDTGILILSQYVEPAYTAELLASGEGGVGYLLKERVGEVRAFLDAVKRVAEGGTALDREVVAELVRSRDPAGDDRTLATLTLREREVLALMAEGRTNTAIARALVVTPGAVEKHVSNIFEQARPADHPRRPPPSSRRPDLPARRRRRLSRRSAYPGPHRHDVGTAVLLELLHVVTCSSISLSRILIPSSRLRLVRARTPRRAHRPQCATDTGRLPHRYPRHR
jgi:DNA-binding NarL/FixJ family response regulator